MMLDWIKRLFEPEPVGPQLKPGERPSVEWNIMFLALPGVYRAQVLAADVEQMHMANVTMAKLQLKLHPDSNDDRQIAWGHLSKYRYVKLLDKLGIPRDNNPAVLCGQILDIEVFEREVEMGHIYTQVKFLDLEG